MCPLNFRLSSGLLVEGGLVLVDSEWSALNTGATAALGRHTASADTGNYTQQSLVCLTSHTRDVITSEPRFTLFSYELLALPNLDF